MPGWLERVTAPLARGLADGTARSWAVALSLWRAIRLLGWTGA
ncbi:hypothetical protein [Thermoflexus sp.]|nr:hypothetical protein [Thermoflexus sp.]MCS6964986.1 hypothetical protein [Thermoflexus sp.]MCX7690773.1 hypothetical protein [Thermoflexus sp.]MDW8184616.1 hypothetical protein [Anaerolineae bacterium]